MQTQLQQCCSSSSSGLHSGQRVLTPASTSSVPWRFPAPAARQQHSRHQQQQCWSSPEDSQAFRFKHKYNPQQLTHLGQGSWFGWPVEEAERATVPGEAARLNPEQTFWRTEGPEDSVKLHNPWASHFRVKRVPMPVPTSLPGSDYWHVEMLNDYSTNWPSIKFADGKLQFRKGFLEPFDDPKVGPELGHVPGWQICGTAIVRSLETAISILVVVHQLSALLTEHNSAAQLNIAV